LQPVGPNLDNRTVRTRIETRPRIVCFSYKRVAYCHAVCGSLYNRIRFSSFIFGPGNGSPMATNVVLVLLLVVLRIVVIYQIFNFLKLSHFASEHN